MGAAVSKARTARKTSKRRETRDVCTRKKEGRSFRVHPLFFLAGVYAAFTRSLPLYLCALVAAIQHEYAHALVAAKNGFCLNKIILMPYGAQIEGDLSGIPLKDGALVALAGPLSNVCTALFFAALWWLFPDTYAFTDTAFYVSLYIGLSNLLPLYPLDGGRILFFALARPCGEKVAFKICRGVTLLFGAACACVAVYFTVRGAFVLPLYFCAACLVVGSFGGGEYKTARVCVRDSFSRGAEIKRVVVFASCPLKRAISFCERGKYLFLDVYDEENDSRMLFSVSETQLFDALSGETLYAPLSRVFGFLFWGEEAKEGGKRR